VISIKKLQTLPRKTRLRKIVVLLQAEELDLGRGRNAHRDYIYELARLLGGEKDIGREVREQAQLLCRRVQERDCGAEPPHREVNRLRNALLRYLGAEPAEWDLLSPAVEGLDPKARSVLPIGVYLEEIRSPFNVGSIFRSCEAFGVERILISPATASPLHPRAVKSARGAVTIMPWGFAELSALEEGDGIFALELGGTPLQDFVFPDRGLMLVGSEELGLSPEALNLAAAKAGRVSIPMAGAKRSLNVAVAVGIVLQAWYRALDI